MSAPVNNDERKLRMLGKRASSMWSLGSVSYLCYESISLQGNGPLRLILRRDQRSGLIGKVTFTLDVRAEISPDEISNIRRYKLGETELYSSHELTDRGSGLLGVASRLAFKATTLQLTVNDLANGKRIEAKDVVELIAIEEHILEAAKTFKQVLDAASHFGGEEAVEI